MSPGMDSLRLAGDRVPSAARTAIRRTDLSRPVTQALQDGLIAPSRSLLDYGCGRGGDVQRLRELGYSVSGWDPAFAPDEPLEPADVVNLGYVINVIESPAERADTLRSSSRGESHPPALTEPCLTVSRYTALLI